MKMVPFQSNGLQKGKRVGPQGRAFLHKILYSTSPPAWMKEHSKHIIFQEGSFYLTSLKC